MTSLNSILRLDDYLITKDVYNKNSNKEPIDWLEYIKCFGKGKQGLTGIVKVKEDGKEKNKNSDKIVFKLSQYINYLSNHEFEIMKGLEKISLFTPHFCRVYGKTESIVEPTVKNNGNPFLIKSKYPIKKDVLFCEYVRGKNLYDIIKNVDSIPDSEIYQVIKQVLLAICLGQQECKLTHYDLHSQNIIISECDYDTVFLYVLDENNQIAIPSCGKIPVIIDYGFSYSSEIEEKPLWTSLAHTHAGFMSSKYDKFADSKLFLATVSAELNGYRKGKTSKKIRRIVKNIFKDLDIDLYSGWDNYTDIGAANYINVILEKDNKNSELFKNYDHYCIDILQSLVILPLENQKYTKISKVYQVFMKDWIKIENLLSDPFYHLYMLKCIVDSARINRPYYNKQSTREFAVTNFKNSIYDSLASISKFSNPKSINFERLLCSLIIFGKNMEGILYDLVEFRAKEKEKEYKKMLVSNVEEIYAIIETNIPDTYTYTKKTKVIVFDNINKKSEEFILSENAAKNVMKLHQLERGGFLYNEYLAG